MDRKIGRVAIVLAALVLCSYALAASPAMAEPELKEANPVDGARLATVPEFLHLCFTEPVKIESDSDWTFSVKPPSGAALGLRIVFEPSGECVDVFPGKVEGDAARGDWVFDWAVHSQGTGDEGSGTIEFNVGEGGSDATPSPSATAQPGDGGGGGDGDGGDALLIALIAAAVILAVAGGGAWVWARRRQEAGPAPQDHGRKQR